MLLFWSSILGASFFRELGDLLEAQSDGLFSLKDYLILESLYNPSRILRFFFSYILKRMERGDSLSAIASPLGLALPPHAIGMHDFKRIFHGIGLLHPLPYPIDTIFKVSAIIMFKGICLPMEEPYTLGLLVVCLIALILREQWSWGYYKLRLVQLYCWECDWDYGMIFVAGTVQPKFLCNSWEKTIWRRMVLLEKDLPHTAQLFASYWKTHYMRQVLWRRKMLGSILQMATLLLFLSCIIPLLQGFYEGKMFI